MCCVDTSFYKKTFWRVVVMKLKILYRVMCYIFVENKSLESYTSSQDTLTSLKVIQYQIISFDKPLKAICNWL